MDSKFNINIIIILINYLNIGLGKKSKDLLKFFLFSTIKLN